MTIRGRTLCFEFLPFPEKSLISVRVRFSFRDSMDIGDSPNDVHLLPAKGSYSKEYQTTCQSQLVPRLVEGVQRLKISLGPSWCSVDAPATAGGREIVCEEQNANRLPLTRFHFVCKVDSIECHVRTVLPGADFSQPKPRTRDHYPLAHASPPPFANANHPLPAPR